MAARIILIITNEDDYRSHLLSMLQDAGYNPFCVPSGQAALDWLAHNQADILLLDLDLPAEEGLDIVQQLYTITSVPLIFVASAADEIVGEKLLATTPYHLLLKPISDQQLLLSIKTVIQQYNSWSTLAVSTDVNGESTKTEAELINSQIILASISDPVAFIDRKYRYLTANEAFCRDLKKEKDEIIGLTVKELFGKKKFKKTFKPYLDRCFKGKTVTYQDWFDVPDDNQKYLDVRFDPAYDVKKKVIGAVVTSRDISVYKRETQRLQQQELLLEKSQSLTRIGSWTWHFRTNKVHWSDEMFSVFGIKAENFGGDIETVIKTAVHPDDQDKLRKTTDQAIKERKPVPLDYRIVWPDGEVRYVTAVGELLYDEQGEAIGLSGVVQDITQHKRTEEALRRSEERYRLLLESITDSIFVLDRELHYIMVNAAMEQFMQKPREQLLGSPITDLFPDIVHTRFYGVLQSVLEYGESSMVIDQYSFNNGRTGWYELNVYPVPEGILCISRDITFKKEAEAALHETEEKIRQIVETTPSMLSITDEKGGNIYVSPNCVEIVGYTDQELMQGFRWWVHEEDTPRAREMFEKTFLDRIGLKNFEYKAVKKNGDTWYASSSWEPLMDSNGVFQGVIIQTFDITERKLAEEKLKQSLREKEVLLREIHHRVKNNLQMVISLLNLQSRNIEDKNALDSFQELQNRIRSIAFIHEMLFQASDLSRIDLAQYVKMLIRHLKSSYKRRKINFELSFPDIYLEISAAIPCGLIINELITNSLKHAYPDKQGGIIAVAGQVQDEELQISVQDDGIGFPKDFLETQSLGLRLIQMLTYQLDGKVDFKSKNGAQTTITFPL